MIDTHAHIYLDDFKDDIDDVITRATNSGIEKILLPNIDQESIESMLGLEKRFPGVCYPMMGLHPCSVKGDYLIQLQVVEQWLKQRTFLAIGEIGTDLYWDQTYWEEQKHAFTIQCKFALSYDLPVVIHCRDSIDQTIDLVANYIAEGLRGVFHCFTGTIDQAEKITGMGFYLGLGGVSTFKNSGLNEVIPHLDQTKIVLETDSPYLSPTPHRGKRNEPSYVNLVAKKVAEFRTTTLEDIKAITYKNAMDLFFP